MNYEHDDDDLIVAADRWVAERYPPYDYASDLDRSLDDEETRRLDEAFRESARRTWACGYEYEITNGAAREINGTFAMLPEREFYADGRTKIDHDEFFDLVHKILFLERRASRVDPTTAVMAVKALRSLTDQLEHEAIAIARRYGWSWRSVGAVLGVDASALHKRYARNTVPKRKRTRRLT